MNEYYYARLFYLVLLGGAIVMSFFAMNRDSLGRITQQALIWAFIFIGVIAVVGLWGDIRQAVLPSQAVMAEQGRIELPQAPDGHYYLRAEVNGAPLDFVVDTGATQIVLSQADARAAGLDVDELAYIGRAFTANGEVRIAPVRLNSLAIGAIEDRNLRAVVNEGEMEQSLLGMDYLGRYTSVEITGGKLVLTR